MKFNFSVRGRATAHLLTGFICFASRVPRSIFSCYLSCEARAGGFFAFVKPVFNRKRTHAHAHTLLRCESKAAGALPASASPLCPDDDHLIMITLSTHVPSFIYKCKGFHKLPYQVLPRGEAKSPRPGPPPTPGTIHVTDHLPPRRAAPNPSLRPEGSRRYPPLTVLSVLGSALSAFQGPAKLIFATVRMPMCHVGKKALARLGKLPRVTRPVRGRAGIQTQVCVCVSVSMCVCVCEHVCACSVRSHSLQPHGL